MEVIKIKSFGLVSPLSSPKNDLNGPKYWTVVLTTTIEYCWGHLGVILGPFRVKLSKFGAPIASYWSQFGADLILFSDPKWPETLKIMYSGIDHNHIVPGRSFRGQFGGNLGQLGPFGAHLGKIWRPNRKIWVIIGPMSLLAAKKGFNIPLYQVQWNGL